MISTVVVVSARFGNAGQAERKIRRVGGKESAHVSYVRAAGGVDSTPQALAMAAIRVPPHGVRGGGAKVRIPDTEAR